MENKHPDGRPQERAPDYRVAAAWSGFLLFVGAGAFVVGMAIHNETLAAQYPPTCAWTAAPRAGPRTPSRFTTAQRRRDAALRALQGQEGAAGRVMVPCSNIVDPIGNDRGSFGRSWLAEAQLRRGL